MEEAEELCEEVALISSGRISDQDTVAGLKERYGAASIEEVYMKVIHAGSR
jgi:ABC-type Na+ transport system ATPase subunit NatA